MSACNCSTQETGFPGQVSWLDKSNWWVSGFGKKHFLRKQSGKQTLAYCTHTSMCTHIHVSTQLQAHMYTLTTLCTYMESKQGRKGWREEGKQIRQNGLGTSDAHSCKVPTTGMSMSSWEVFSSRANKGMPPALRMASLFEWLLLQLQSARAPQRATSTSLVSYRLGWVGSVEFCPQSNRVTYTNRCI